MAVTPTNQLQILGGVIVSCWVINVCGGGVSVNGGNNFFSVVLLLVVVVLLLGVEWKYCLADIVNPILFYNFKIC